METIPEELQKRWTQKDSLPDSPAIAVINLLDEDSAPPLLDFLDDPWGCPIETEEWRFHAVKTGTEDARFHGVKLEDRESPWIDPQKLHGTLSTATPTISIATYVPKQFPKTDTHS